MNLLTAILLLLPVFAGSYIAGVPLTSMKSLFRFSRINRKRKASKDLHKPGPPRAMIVQNSPLLALPDEILVTIVEHLEYESLLAAKAVSSHLRALAEPRIYRDYEIGHGKKSLRLAALIEANPERATWLRSVLVSTRFEEDGGLWHFPDQLRQMRNLRDLVLETPDCNHKLPVERVNWVMLQEEYESIFSMSTLDVAVEERVLGQLQRCVMHLVDDKTSLYSLPKYASIFLHPTLKSLTLSCACTDFPELLFPRQRQYERSTALEYLHLEECDIDPRTLELLLKFPKALKSLKLSEGTRYDEGFGSRRVRMHGNVLPGVLSNALTRSVGDTLETLSLSLGYRINSAAAMNFPSRALDLRQMTRLSDLSLSWLSLTLVCPRPFCDHQTYRRLPSTLETLRVFGIPLIALRGGPLVPLNSCIYKQKTAHGLPNLKTIVYTYEYQTPIGRTARGLIERPRADLVSQVISACKESVQRVHNRRCPLYKKYGVRVIVEMEATPPGFIPPYLHNEEHPITLPFWDSNDVECDVKEVKESERSSSEEEEESDEDDEIELEGRRLSQLVPRVEELINLLIMQPGNGLPI